MILRVTTHDRIKVTKHELDTVYSLADLLDFIEDIEVLAAMDESEAEKMERRREIEKQKQNIR